MSTRALVTLSANAVYCSGGQFPHYKFLLAGRVWVNFFPVDDEEIELGETMPAFVRISRQGRGVTVDAIYSPDSKAKAEAKVFLAAKVSPLGGENDGFSENYPCEQIVVYKPQKLKIKVGFMPIENSPA